VTLRLISRRTRLCAAIVIVSTAAAGLASPPPAVALNPVKPVCSVASFLSGLLGKACSVVEHGGRLLQAGKQLLGGHFGGAVKTTLGEGSGSAASTATTALALAAIGTWVFGGAKFALHETGSVLTQTTSPQLGSTWFSSAYWRVAAIGAVLTLPFLFAAAIQAVVRSDITLLARATLGYLPLAMLAVAIAAPLTMLLLAATDQLSAIVSSAAGNQSAHFLDRTSGLIGALTSISLSPFLAFLVGLLTVIGAVGLWLELMVREAAVYVVVLMMPLVFAAFVWPARRVWALRSIELLIALILSKFAIVAVLSLGAAALEHSGSHRITGALAGIALLSLGVLTPWALLRLLPLAEIASSTAGSLRREARAGLGGAQYADARATEADDWASKTAHMRRAAESIDEPQAGRQAKDNLDANGSLTQAEGSEQSRFERSPSPLNGAAGARSPDPVPSAHSPSSGESLPASQAPDPASTPRGAFDPSPTKSASAAGPSGEETVATPGPLVFPLSGLDGKTAVDLANPTDQLLTSGDASGKSDQHGEPANSEVGDPTPPPQPPDRGRL
jgi:hypothetical protein